MRGCVSKSTGKRQSIAWEGDNATEAPPGHVSWKRVRDHAQLTGGDV